ncbi:hypothetical protein MSAN_02118700 [Mycena sanguinolenta]|uniref:Uncharacterized protein n=1 Tax=Mycena sanguinolenta TaxID=230812 RepID=A0A8H6XH15_9AGAR|nr:hypothetical protein MSAN_02118700 [Mycena sanguinolenta]
MAAPSTHIDLVRNRTPNSTLGPFDGKVAALVQLRGESYFITTHADYVPALLSLEQPHAVFLRSDLRYRTDNPTLWPQEWTAKHCHLAAIQKPGSCSEMQIMWWNLTPQDFVFGSAVMQGIGRLRPYKLSQFLPPVNDLVARCTQLSPTRASPLFGHLINGVLIWIEQLQMLPTTYTKMVFAVTSLQRTFLELDALYEYMTKYKRRIDNYSHRFPESTPVAPCIGAFTFVPLVAQQLWAARLPVWLLRPSHTFDSENILAEVSLLQPHHITLDALDEDAAISRAAVLTPWYWEAFKQFTNCNPPTAPVASGSCTVVAPVPPASSDVAKGSSSRPTSSQKPQPRRSHPNHQPQRYSPYSSKLPQKPAPNNASNNPGPHDKFQPLTIPEMPPFVRAWADALVQVDKSHASSAEHAALYVLPEPALLVNSERRCTFIHHWTLLSDGFLYMLSQPTPPQFLSNQEWRDILEGHLELRGHPKSRTHTCSKALEDRIRPALLTSNVSKIQGFPVPPGQIPPYSLQQIHEIVWQVAETNFRFEFAALDRLASGQDRLEDVKRCFAGGMFVGVPLELSKKGWAAIAMEDRERYIIRTAKLMLGWTTRARLPAVIRAAENKNNWLSSELQALEIAVCCHYTQAFWEYLGRAAVIPMCLDHDIEKEDGEL